MRKGFTIVELVVIIAIIGVISVFVSARVSGMAERTRAFHDQLLSQVQYARKVAVAQRRSVCAHVGAPQSRLFYADAGAGNCPAAAGVAAPTGELPFAVAVPGGVAVDTVTLQFDALGRPRSAAGALLAAQVVVNVAGDGNYPITIDHETGYVR